MGIFNRHSRAPEPTAGFTMENASSNEKVGTHSPTAENLPGDGEVAPANSLHRGLHARHITMIAIGGAIGTGLIIGTGSALQKAGPGSIFISYTLVGLIVYIVMSALGEMATWLPMASGFTGYATRFCSPSLGFALGWTYWFKYIIVTPNQLTAASIVIQFWVPRDKVNPGVFIAIFLVIIIFINWFGIRFFGEFEFWLSSIKVITILGLIILTFTLAMGGGPNHDRTGFRYWSNPGAFKQFNGYPKGSSAGIFLSIWSTVLVATFAYLGTELVGVTVGEAENPRRNVPRAIKLTFYRILVFYCLSVLLLGMVVPYNDSRLEAALSKGTGASASPFVVAIQIARIPVLPHILNAAILIFVFSASNSDLYIATRTIYGLSVTGNAPAFLSHTDKRGVPIYALGVSSLFGLLAFMNVANDSKQVFSYFVNLVSIFGLLTWISILVAHIYFVRARNAQGVDPKTLHYKAPGGVYASYAALFMCIIIAFTKNFQVFIHNPKTYGKFDYKNFITGYLGIPLYLIMIFGHMLITRSKGVKPETADLWSGKQEIDDEEARFLREQERLKASGAQRGGKFYNRYIGWLF